MKLLVTGGRGQLGRALLRRGTAHEIVARDIDTLDICDRDAFRRALDEIRPEAVINAAAYTGVDKAEADRDRAFGVNAAGAGVVARACNEARVAMLHVSTDYVFDGSANVPIVEATPTRPINVYGASKARGEELVREHDGTVVRTSWLFGHGGPSFVHTMMKLAKERPVLRVVADQIGCPTWAADLADALFALLGAPRDIYHFSNVGPTTWHAFASAIVDEARKHGPVACERIEPITTGDYPTPAKRPMYSVLATDKVRARGITPPAWTIGLQRVVAEG